MQNQLISKEIIENKIYIIKGHKVMLDSDLAWLYGVETKRIGEAVKRNIERFPEKYMFKLTTEEWDFLRSQIATSKQGQGGRRYTPRVFTEHGVLMLANVLNSSKAISVSIQIIDAFVKLRQIAIDYKDMPQRLSEIEKLLMLYIEKNDERVNDIIQVLNNLLESPKKPKEIGFRID
ncbi:MAG TPA: ORF6N domain-containing protein [Candidatus Gastranaerophilales bacterium]|nr:ORF6N domain-containing protein [Candidatus Gastranaerophilales bacterium]